MHTIGSTGKHWKQRKPRQYAREARDSLLDGHELLNDSLRATIEDQRVEIAALKFEVIRLRELAEQRRLDLVECRENMRGIRRHK